MWVGRNQGKFSKTPWLAGISILLFLLSAARTAQTQSASADTVSPESLYKEAGAAYDRRDFVQAIHLYEQLVQMRPDSVEARTDFGVALAHVGRYVDAVTQYHEALQHDPKNPVVRLNLALAWYKQAEFVKAADELAGLRKDHPEGQQSLYLLADCYLRLGENREAISLLQPAYDANPDDRAVDYALGTALIRDGQVEKGGVVIDRIMNSGDTGVVNLLIGAAQLAGGDPKTAVATIRKALDTDANLPGGWSLYAQALQENGEIEEAKDAFQRALRADPNDYDANLRLGALLRHGGNFQEAAAYLQRALELRPASVAARYQVGAVNLGLGNLEAARKDLEQVARDTPDFQEVHAQLATLYARLKLPAESQREREIVLKLNEKSRATGPQPNQ
jgi:tetratricopeptide (TPR) repeat protein